MNNGLSFLSLDMNTVYYEHFEQYCYNIVVFQELSK